MKCEGERGTFFLRHPFGLVNDDGQGHSGKATWPDKGAIIKLYGDFHAS